MKDNKLPHFPFFARDWLTDERVMLMDLAQQGAYIKLLCYQWLEKSIPMDPKQLAALCGVSPEYFLEDIWPSIDPSFSVIGDRLVNPRMEEIRAETEARVAKAVENGKKVAAKRWKNSDPNSDPNGPPMADHSDPNAIHNQSHIHNQSQDDDSSDAPVSKSGVITELSADVYEALMFNFGFGHHKALSIVETLEPTTDDLNDWRRYEEAKGTRLTRHHMKRYKNARDVPQEKEGTDNAKQRKTFSQMEADDYAAKKAELEKEMGEDG